MRLVRAANRAMTHAISKCGCRETIWSDSQIESIPRSSARSAYAQIVCGLGMPRRHRPKPMPILTALIGVPPLVASCAYCVLVQTGRLQRFAVARSQCSVAGRHLGQPLEGAARVAAERQGARTAP